MPDTLDSTKPTHETFNFWKVIALSSLAVALINLGLLYFLTMWMKTLILEDAIVYNVHPKSYVLTEKISTASGMPAQSPEKSASPSTLLRLSPSPSPRVNVPLLKK